MNIHKQNKHTSLAHYMAALFTLLAVLMMFPTHSLAQAAGEIDAYKLDSFLNNFVSDNRIPGLAVAVVQGDQVVFQKGYGQAGYGKAITPQTQFYLGSASKSFTALAAIQLVEQGLLELDAPVQKYLPWFQVADAEASQQITIRNLLNHTSGLSEGADPGAAHYSSTLREQVEGMKAAELTAPVGEKYQYDSQNYRILALLIEQVSGQSYDAYLRDHVFTPLGMNRTTADPTQFSNLAQGYGQLFGFPLPREEKFQPAGVGSGYIVSTVEDMGKFLVAMLNQAHLKETSLISPGSFSEMITPPEDINSEYGMGWVITDMNGEKTIYHGGSLANYHAFVMMLPEKHTGFVFLSNQNGIIPMFTVFNSLKMSLMRMLSGNALPARSSYQWIFWLLRLFAIITVVWQIYRLIKLPNWFEKNFCQKPWKRWLKASLNLFIPLLFLGLPFFAKTFLGASSASWQDAYGMLPDFVLWLMIFLSLNLAVGLASVWMLTRNQPVGIQ